MSDLPVRLHDLIDHVVGLHPDGTPLERLSDAVATGGELGELQDHLVGHFVDQARRSGASSTEIGTSIGVSKQGAQQRFVPKASDLRDLLANGAGLLSRFTPRARAVVVGARDDARSAGNDSVSSAHVLFGLAADPASVGSRAIVAQGPSLEDVRLAAAATFGPPAGRLPEHVPFSSEAKSLLELAVREALRMGHNYVGTEHLILALASDPKSSSRARARRLRPAGAGTADVDRGRPRQHRPPARSGVGLLRWHDVGQAAARPALRPSPRPPQERAARPPTRARSSSSTVSRRRSPRPAW